MSTHNPMPEFDQLAAIYWRLGGMQSPSQLQGYLVGQLAVGEELETQQWVAQAASYIDAVEPPNLEESQLLVALYVATESQLSAGDMALTLLLPDDAVEITQRLDSIGQWCQGFMAGFARGGKSIQQQQGQQQYSQDVSEAITDLAAISQIGLSDDDSDLEQSEQNIFEISEYMRLAAITIYMECAQGAAKSAEPAAGVTPQSLFNKPGNKLH